MRALGGGGHGGLWGWDSLPKKPKQQRKRFDSKSSNSVEATGGPGFRFPLKQAVTAGSLALTGDTIAQLRERWRKAKTSDQQSSSSPNSQVSEISLIFIFISILWGLLSEKNVEKLERFAFSFLLFFCCS